MRLGRIGAIVIVAGTAALGPGIASATDIVDIFQLSGTFADGATLSGNLTIDTTTGVVESGDAMVGSPLNYDMTYDQTAAGVPTPDITEIVFRTGGGFPALVLGVDAPNLIGFDGGFLLSTSQPVDGYTSAAYETADLTVALTSGNVTSVPEPLTLSLFGAGLIGAAAMRRRKNGAIGQIENDS